MLTRNSLLPFSLALTVCTLKLPSVAAGEPLRRLESHPESMPWKLEALADAPEFSWADEKSPVRTLYYRGERFQERSTRVFACYATPGTLAGDRSADRELPGVVLVHGGGGTAFPEWVELWARRGYAALAMDLGGSGPEKKRLEDGGPEQSDESKFLAIDQPVTEQWTYHAVANVIRAHSLLRSFREVDLERTALTGISWGGYLTCIVAGLDNRFQAAVPVYGCGFLHENSIWDGRFARFENSQRTRWVRLWDPSQYIGSATMPMLFINGTNDCCYPLDSYAKTYDLVQSERNFRITVGMPHGHRAGWEPVEIGIFIDAYLLGGAPLAKIARPSRDASRAIAAVVSATELVGAELHYTTDAGFLRTREWTSQPAAVADFRLSAARPPAGTTAWFFTATDVRGATVSSELVFGRPSHSALDPVPRPGGWFDRHERFNARAREGDVDLVFIGDSITQGWETDGQDVWEKYYGKRRAANMGIGGDRTQYVLWRLDHGNVDGIQPKVVVVMLGTNNCSPGRNTPAETVDGLKAVVKKLRAKVPTTRILLLGIFPRSEPLSVERDNVLRVNEEIRNLDDGERVHYLDIGPNFLEPDGSISKETMPDLVHLTAKGYEIWASSIEAKLTELLGLTELPGE